jgi:hypothetical protein
VPLAERVEGRLIDAVGTHELADVGHDLPLLRGQRGGIALGAKQVDHLFAQPGAARRADLRRPHVGGLTLPYGGQDGDGAEPSLDHTVFTEELDQRKHPLGELRAVQQHAERATHAAEYLDDAVHHMVMLGRDIGLSGDRGDSRHGGGSLVWQ